MEYSGWNGEEVKVPRLIKHMNFSGHLRMDLWLAGSFVNHRTNGCSVVCYESNRGQHITKLKKNQEKNHAPILARRDSLNPKM